MKINQNLTIHRFASWDREPDSKTHLTVLRTGDAVTLAFSPTYLGAANVEMTLAEANEVSHKIAALFNSKGEVLKWDERKRPETDLVEEDSPLVVEVRITNQGEPYEEGVSLVVRQQNLTEVAYIDLACDAACRLSKVLSSQL